MRRAPAPAATTAALLALLLSGCSLASLVGGAIECTTDAACPETAPFCVDFVCSKTAVVVVGEGEGEGEGEGDVGEGEGEGDVGEGDGEGEGEGDVGEGEGEGDEFGRVAYCAGVRVDVEGDAGNCDECNNECGVAGEGCDVDTVCTNIGCFCPSFSFFGCEQGTVDCGGACVDLDDDAANCGECGNVCDTAGCAQAVVCVDGGCVCPSTAGPCGQDQVSCNDACVNVANDVDNCGECGNECVDDGVFCDGHAACVDGGCVEVDPPCGDAGCDEANGDCGPCSFAFPCPVDGAFCDAAFVCQGGVCIAGDRCGADVVCDAFGEVCVDCVDDGDCADDDALLCNGVAFCQGGACAVELNPCGPLTCSEEAGCQ